MLRDYRRAYGLQYAALRYFNAAGASIEGDIGEDHDPESHLIPITLQVALGQRDNLTIFGESHGTSDGTCIRDYVHVEDLATAHQLALEKTDSMPQMELNLGTGRGHSVRDILESCRQITGRPIGEQLGEPRPGDPPELVADATKAREILGWKPVFTDIDETVETAWRWHRAHPHGYASG
jgi:UDP-glucose 4-epimerase